MNDEDHPELLLQALDGDASAIERLAARTRELSRDFARMHRLSPEGVSSVVQISLGRFEILLANFDPERCPGRLWQGWRAYVRQVVANNANTYIPKQKPTVAIGDHDLPGLACGPLDAVQIEELRRTVRAAILDVEADHPERAEAIRLFYIEGLAIREIADRMNRSPDSIKHLLARTREALRGPLTEFQRPD